MALTLATALAVAGCGEQAAAGHTAVKHPREGRFDNVRGWLAVGGHSPLVALDPDLPSARVSLFDVHGTPLAWSLDGTKLLVSGAHGLNVMGTDGRLIHVAPRYATGGSFTWDGGWVIYGAPGGVFRVPATGGAPQRISTRHLSAFGDGWQPSPDGLIPFMHNRDIWVMRANGGHERLLVKGSAIQAQAGSRKVVELNMGGWTRDGSLFAFTTSTGKPLECRLFVVGKGGAGLHRVPISSGCARAPNWSPDGQHVVVTTGTDTLMIVDTRGKLIRRIHVLGLFGGAAWNTARPPERYIEA